MPRGRKSAAAGRSGRAEQRIWREVVDALPGHWFDSAGHLVLRRLAAQAALSERQEARHVEKNNTTLKRSWPWRNAALPQADVEG
jgi:hypothetical protein